MRGSDVGRANTRPFRIEPDFGKVGEDGVESSNNEGADVLKDRDSGSNHANCLHHMGPDATSCPFDPGALAGVADVLAGEPRSEDVDLGDGGPRESGDVAEVRHIRVMVSEDLRRTRVRIRDPRKVATKDRLHSGVQAAIARAETADTHGHHPCAMSAKRA